MGNKKSRKKQIDFTSLSKSEKVKTALDIVDDDLPDGAWLAMMSEVSGLPIDELCDELSKQFLPVKK